MFEISISKDINYNNLKNTDKRRIPTYLLVYLLILIVRDLKISVEQGRGSVRSKRIKH